LATDNIFIERVLNFVIVIYIYFVNLFSKKKNFALYNRYIHNTYQCPAELVVNGKSINGHISSEEGVTQGDVCAMAMYGVSTKPIIMKLQKDTDINKCRQCWYADDAW
jgi:hypothetical protein